MQARTVFAALCLALAGCASAQTSAPFTEARAQVMVLGVYHFRAGGSDYVANQLDDHLSPRRQTEIAEVLDRLERFQPTKIVVELDPNREAEFNSRYTRYRTGAETLGVNERDQLGMVLANRLGLERLYAADADSDMHFDQMLAAAEAAGQTHLVEQFRAGMASIEAHQAATRDLSVRDRLIDVNSPEVVGWNDFYMTMAQMGAQADPIGAHDMAAWWGRNIHIFAGIARIAEPGDRILVIYGHGHKALLDQYFRQAHEFQLVDPLTYLR
ncbi:hypothetical protein DSM104635_03380 [Terricaulis silvestris]|uniref:Uncharacterized protein n=2 Tax=Terricaulis silvestris TaxID=2686094 RepID=A0A6I6MMK7_9CAUL|nr:hypothetical protein DSM104635_03380 [Terricaulis silvestris]